MAGKKGLSERFELEREVGRGGGGVVYRAVERDTSRQVALKVFESDKVETHGAHASEVPLLREARVLERLQHESIVGFVDSGELEPAGAWLAMEWLAGEDLEQRLRREPLSLAESVQITEQVASALAHAHGRGITHCDVKPSNILLCSAPARAVLMDFGVALIDGQPPSTTTQFFGTPSYMSPEQARGDVALDARCDMYSLGATLFEMLCGRPPHVAPSNIATLARLVLTPPPRVSFLRPGVPAELDDIVEAMLCIDPTQRPGSMHDVVELLTKVARDPALRNVGVSDSSLSMRLGSGTTRLVTTLVALDFPSSDQRDRSLLALVERGADAVPLTRDALVAHFGARRALGTEAITGLELGRTLAQGGAKVGIASGRARVAARDATGAVHAIGDVVDRASALARDAAAGEVLADTSSSELGRGRYEFRRRDNGSSVVGEALRGVRAEQTGGAPFVGRDTELAQVLSAVDRCAVERTPVVISITGPSGIGKSRLRREAVARVAVRSDAPEFVLQRSAPHGRRDALGAASDVLRGLLRLRKGSSTREVQTALMQRAVLATAIDAFGRFDESLTHFLTDKSLPSDNRRTRDLLWLAMTDLVLQVLRQNPVAIVMEDVQWADEESITWVDHLLSRAAGLPLLLVVITRPEFWDKNPRQFLGRDHVRLNLPVLSKRAALVLARAVWGTEAKEDALAQIVERSAGMPLFTEELARLAATGGSIENTPTIESVIQAGLDALTEEQRDAIGRLSVFGMRVWDDGLSALGFASSTQMMQGLTQAEILEEQQTARFDGVREWSFKHALVHEVAYAALGDLEKKELHGLAAQWLAQVGEDAAVVAGHFDLAGKEMQAAQFWGRAARRALTANALTDAQQMAERALAFADTPEDGFAYATCSDQAWARLDPGASDRESAIWALEDHTYDERSRVIARGARARYDDARGSGEHINDRLAEVRDDAFDLGLHDEEAQCSAQLAARLAFAGELDAAKQEAARLLTLADVYSVESAAVDGWQTLAITNQTQGALNAALEARRNAARAARKAGLRDREATLTANLGFALTTLGARKESRDMLLSSLDLATALGSPGTERHAKMILLCWGSVFGTDSALDTLVGDVRREADEASQSAWTSPAREKLGILYYRGCELINHGSPADLPRALALFRLSAEGYRSTNNRDVLAVALGMWSSAELRAGNPDQALALAQEGAALLAQGGPSLLSEAPVYVALHDALIQVGATEQARAALEAAMAPLLRRVKGLVGTKYARTFLTEVPSNSVLVSKAEGYGLIPDKLYDLLESGV